MSDTEILLQPTLALMLPLALFTPIYLACRKENLALDVEVKYRLAVLSAIAFAFYMVPLTMLMLRRGQRVKIELLQSACLVCSTGLVWTSLRLGVRRPWVAWGLLAGLLVTVIDLIAVYRLAMR